MGSATVMVFAREKASVAEWRLRGGVGEVFGSQTLLQSLRGLGQIQRMGSVGDRPRLSPPFVCDQLGDKGGDT